MLIFHGAAGGSVASLSGQVGAPASGTSGLATFNTVIWPPPSARSRALSAEKTNVSAGAPSFTSRGRGPSEERLQSETREPLAAARVALSGEKAMTVTGAGEPGSGASLPYGLSESMR